MKIEQIYTGCLAQGAYYIESKGEVAIIDPLREVKPYIQKAAQNNAKINYVFETHFHADFVSGHLTLAKETGAKIVFGPTANTSYDVVVAEDNQEFRIGEVTIKVLHTPGHTMESVCYLLIDEQGVEHALFSGDTLFIGDVGRPDLAVKSTVTKEDLAGFLYESLRNKIMTLPDTVLVYPAHGAGSACGKNMSKETFDTLGNQKKVNYALNDSLSKESFIKQVTEGLEEAPGYFSENVRLNKEGYKDVSEVVNRGTTPLSCDEFEQFVECGALMLDARSPQLFKDAFIPNSINIGIYGGFAPWVGALVPSLDQPIVLLVEEGMEEEVVTRMSRVGYDNTLGFLKGGITEWIKEGKDVDSLVSISAQELEERLKGDVNVIDARKVSEYQSQAINSDKVINLPLQVVNERFAELEKTEEYIIHCGGGYRSMIMGSILKSRGYNNVIDVDGGFKSIKETSIELTNFVCPSEL